MTNSIEKTRDITGHASATITNYVGNLSSKKSNSIHCKNEIYQIDKNSSSRPSQHIIKALNEMAKAIYPNVYK